MTGRSVFNIRIFVVFLLILIGPVVSLFSQDTEISGIVNIYRKVTAIGSFPPNNVTLSSVDSVAAGDTIMLIQMQGVKINTDNGSYGLIYLDSIGTPGAYEILLVDHIETPSRKVYFTRYIQNSFDVRGKVQLIVVPSYDKAKVKGRLTSKAWDSSGGTGGVLAMIVGSRLELDKSDGEIDVSGKGFRGGLSEVGLGECVFSDFTLYSRDSYASTWNNAGNKGEGVASHDLSEVPLFPLHAKGQGPNYTGGGGGNGRYAGAGGGANRGRGLDGKGENNFPQPDGCGGANAYTGALGGITTPAPLYTLGFYLGGGGGSSTRASGGVVSNGGNGGGIIIIMADTIAGNGRSIKADGARASDASGNSGGGGGGAGGSILFSLRAFSDKDPVPLKISVRGGLGGYHNSWGEGGGGGGGLLSISLPALPSNVLLDTAYGTLISPPPTSFSEGFGDLDVNTIPQLNGFLFNAIRSEVTGTQIDSICSNVPFGKLVGTEPTGGQLPYIIKWQKSTVSGSSGFQDIAGATLKDYTPGSLSQTTWFRRVVTDNSSPLIVDVSIPVKVTVHQAITGNNVGKDTTICYGQNPLPLIPLNSGPSNGNGKYTYKWLQNSSDVALWDTTMSAAGSANRAAAYDPPALNDTTFYKRFVMSGRCIDFSSDAVKITVLSLIQGNEITRSDSVICEDFLFESLGASPVSGADAPNFSYLWQESNDAINWVPAFGSNDLPAYVPDTARFPDAAKLNFRRVVFSGPDSVCRDNSARIGLVRYPAIRNNNILSPSPICQEVESRLILNATQPVQGSGQYTYSWEKSENSGSTWDFVSAASLILNTTAPNTSAWFRRVVTSSECISVSPPVLVQRTPDSNPGTVDVVCGGTVRLNAIPSTATATGKWYFNPLTLPGSDRNRASVTVRVDSLAFSNKASQNLFFTWEETNGNCIDRDSVEIFFFTHVKELGPDRDSSLYSFDKIIHLIADPIKSWETGLWEIESGTSSIEDETTINATASNLSEGLNACRWTVVNSNSSAEAICYDTYLVNVRLYDIFIPNAFSPNGDGLYDAFSVKGVDLENQKASLRILNSAGTEVFYTTNEQGKEWSDWDGRSTNGSELPEGTYYYLLELTSTGNGQVYKKSGFILLKRYGQD